MLNTEYIDLLKQLIAVPSFSREETAACDLLEQWMLSHKMYPLRRGNNLLLATNADNNTTKPILLLNAHIDTVHPSSSYTRDPFTPYQEGDVLYGLGSNDDGGSLIALLATFLKLKDTDLPYNLFFSATAEEEVSGKNGIEMLLPEIGDIALAVVGEPTQMQMAVAEKGLMVLDCTAIGRAGHAAREEGENALYKAIDDINTLRNHHFDKISPYLGEVKTTTTMINAGLQHNIIPDNCQFVVDVRSNGMYSNRQLLAEIKALLQSDVKERSTRLNASHIDDNHPVVRRACTLNIPLFGSPTTSNQSLLACPSVKIGPGDSARSHTADEFIRISEIENGITVYLQLLNGLQL